MDKHDVAVSTRHRVLANGLAIAATFFGVWQFFTQGLENAELQLVSAIVAVVALLAYWVAFRATGGVNAFSRWAAALCVASGLASIGFISIASPYTRAFGPLVFAVGIAVGSILQGSE